MTHVNLFIFPFCSFTVKPIASPDNFCLQVNDLMSISPQLKRGDGTRALIISPTRELCQQIEDVLSQLTTKSCCYIVSGCISGGEKKKSEKARLRKGVVVLVSTPGRLLDHLKTTESFTLTNLRWIVLDEADRLLDMGFEQSVLEILSTIRGVNLPGLKERVDKTRVSSGQLLDLNYAYKVQKSTQAKISTTGKITHVMASATLTRCDILYIKTIACSPLLLLLTLSFFFFTLPSFC